MSLANTTLTIPIKNPIIYPDVTSSIFLGNAWHKHIEHLLDSQGIFNLAYYSDKAESKLYRYGTQVSIIDYKKLEHNNWQLFVKGDAKIILSSGNPDHQIHTSEVTYHDEHLISTEEEDSTREILQKTIDNKFPNMPKELKHELMHNFSIHKLVHYLCFISQVNTKIKISYLKEDSLINLYHRLINNIDKS